MVAISFGATWRHDEQGRKIGGMRGFGESSMLIELVEKSECVGEEERDLSESESVEGLDGWLVLFRVGERLMPLWA